MICLSRTGKHTLAWTADDSGFQAILDAARAVLTRDQPTSVTCTLDLRVAGRRRFEGKLTLAVGEDRISRNEGRTGIVWHINREDVEYLVQVLHKRLTTGHFEVREFSRVRCGSRKANDLVFLYNWGETHSNTSLGR